MGASNAGEDLALWRNELVDFLTTAFGEMPEQPLSLLRPPGPVLDDVMKLRIRDSAGRNVGVALCSSPDWPEMVARGVECGRRARASLGNELGAVVLAPRLEGRRDGRSYAVLPFCEPLDPKRLWWPIQRRRVRGAVSSWLTQATAHTSRALHGNELDANFRAPLLALSEMRGISSSIRRAAANSMDRLTSGGWTPRHVLMHGDLWEGNTLHGENRFGFVIIDWAGSRTDGYGIFDLVRWAISMRMSSRQLREELETHCKLLACDFEDARSTLLAALAALAADLNQFPLADYSAMADRCLGSLEQAGG